jgi:hypothetical protein
MNIRLSTWHSADFDILAEFVDPARSPYAGVPDYTQKVKSLYAQLGILSAVWAYPKARRPAEPPDMSKPIEYLLEVSDNRVAAYVESRSWSEYLWGSQQSFEFSTAPAQYGNATILIPTPLKREEVKAMRRFEKISPGFYRLIEELPFE